MKSVGKQLEEARLARNWTPELAARETKIKVDRLRDLEADDYTHFSSPTYARGFVRTYARSLGLDEYQILRQLDHKLPEDETSSFAADTGIPYIPETSKAPRASSGSNTGLYIALSLGFGVLLVMAFILFEAYRAGVLPTYFAESSTPEPVAATNTATEDAPARAQPVDPNVVPIPPTNEATDTSSAPRALPVDPNSLALTTPQTNVAPDTGVPVHAVRALPVDPSELTNAPPATQVALAAPPTPVPIPAAPPAQAPPLPVPAASVTNADLGNAPRALPVSPTDLAAMTPTTNVAMPVAPITPPPEPTATPVTHSASARQSNSGPVQLPTPAPPAPDIGPPVPATADPAAPAPTTAAATLPTTNIVTQVETSPTPDKPLILTASRDSFIRVTTADGSDAEKVLYASVLHTGQSVGFAGRKFSINVGIPAAIDITLDGVNYGPHSTNEAPETFTLESHQP